MRYRLKSLSLATATLLLSLTSPLFPLTLNLKPLVVQAQTLEQQEPGAEKWFLEAYQLYIRSEYPATLAKLQQDLTEFRNKGDRAREGAVLTCMGVVYRSMGQPTQALDYLQNALTILREVGKSPHGDRSTARLWEGRTLNQIGVVYSVLGRYGQALHYSQQALVIQRAVGDRIWEGRNLNDLATIYSNLGQNLKALEYFQQALAIYKETGQRSEQGRTLSNIAIIYFELEQYPKALEYSQQALAIAKEIGEKAVEVWNLGIIGSVYRNLKQYPKALEFYQQALAIEREVGDKRTQGGLLIRTGLVYYSLEQYPKALEFYQQALAISREVGVRDIEGANLSLIGLLLEVQKQPELAIVFYKQSVNVIEEIRKDLQVLPKDLQQSYTETVAGIYRRLANLLLKQDRVLEAQRVLDLLKVQELDDYLRNVRGNNNTAQGLPNLPPEQTTWTSYEVILNKAVEIGKELTQLRKIKPENRTTEQEQRIAQLVNAQEKIVEDFNNFTESSEVSALVQQLNPKARKVDLVNNLDELIALQDNLRNLQQKAVLLYPLILDDRIELILTTPDSPPIRRTVPVPKKQLNEAIVAFRSALLDPTSDAKTPAQQLYNWLIKPLEADLKAADAETIIYAPDAQLRYIPLAALYDGQQWLVQRYRINNITAASLTDLNTKPQRQLQVLAGAFTTGRYSFTVGGESFNFSGLPSAGVEVENLAKTVPSTTKFIDTAFTPQVTVPKMDDYTVVHLATHAAFVVGTPDDSFILFGNGERVTLRDIQTWSLKNIDLVVLSACETGLGGKLGNGEEILGLGYQMQRAGARAAIASLWSVSDGGTQALMDSFYTALESKDVGQNIQPTKAEALRQAQIALITGDYTALGGQRGIGLQQRIRNNLPPQVASRLSHPYYWAPFILIGNGL
jgi:CHAT domain-containing protein/tetratricopeptide (TPR) repeat protein